MTENELRYHLEEFRVLRGEIAATTKLLHDTFFWASLASGGIAAWLLTNFDSTSRLGPAGHLAGFIPFCIAGLACLGFYHFHTLILNVAAYLRRLEARVAAEGLGWEACQRGDEARSIATMSKVRFAFGWAALLAGDLGFALVVF